MSLESLPTNQQLQVEVFQQNAQYAFNYINEELGFFEGLPRIQGCDICKSLYSRAFNEAPNLWGMRKVQMDLISFYLLCKNWYNFSSLESDLIEISWNEMWTGMRVSDFFEVFERFKREKAQVDSLDITVPQILQDTIISQKTSWQQPPAKELEKAVTYFWDEAFSKLSANPEY